MTNIISVLFLKRIMTMMIMIMIMMTTTTTVIAIPNTVSCANTCSLSMMVIVATSAAAATLTTATTLRGAGVVDTDILVSSSGGGEEEEEAIIITKEHDDDTTKIKTSLEIPEEEEQQQQQQQQQHHYGTQCSFAITGPTLDGCGDSTGSDTDKSRQQFYNTFMQECYAYYSQDTCTDIELQRLAMNQRQPQSMMNMTTTGYHKVKAPESLIQMLTDFWQENKEKKELEEWGDGSIYTNHWKAPTYMVNVEDPYLAGGGHVLKTAIWDAALAGVEAWTTQGDGGGSSEVKLRPVSLYGIREYTEGAILSPHVDRVPLVSSGIVNVAQDVDEPWPLEVYDRQGMAVNITMEPGDMILYESHSLIHGRPFPLRGRYYANVFIHFEPFEGLWEHTNNASDTTTTTTTTATTVDTTDSGLPPYIIPGSPEEDFFRRSHPQGWSKNYAEGEERQATQFSQAGDLSKLKLLALQNPQLMWKADENGWTPLHEAVRGSHLEVVEFLVDQGAGVNEVTGDGLSPLRIAINYLGSTHAITKMLRELDAKDVGAADIDDDFDPEHDDNDDHDNDNDGDVEKENDGDDDDGEGDDYEEL